MMAGLQLPGTGADDLKNIGDDLKEKGDAEIGMNVSFALQLGINASFITDGLYLGIKFGTFKTNYKTDGNKFEYDLFTIGLTANYLILDKTSIGFGVIRWRGLNFGTGLLYQSAESKLFVPLDKANGTDSSFTLTIDPDLRFTIDSKALTIPLEFTTAIRLLWFANLHVGLGADLNFGKTDIKMGIEGPVTVTAGSGTSNNDGHISATNKAKANPDFIKPKIMAGLGIGVNDVVIIDVPFTYYVNDGFNVGVTLGTVW
ncbi:MAG: hypothetical protein LBT84_03395, partial [Spirochaetia bacterium]|jgi:hypothetical protein|nr:hypothetical protein [Spirochaetia bacterium]